MFESPSKLAEEISELLLVVREVARGRYACLVEPEKTIFENPSEAGHDLAALQAFLEDRRSALFSLPSAMASEEPMEDVFAGWNHDEFLLAFLNGRVALVVACPEAARAQEQTERPLRALADRLLRYNPTYRMDGKGRGFFFGSPRLDLVVVGRS